MSEQETLNWNDLATTRVGDVEPPKMIPPGHYQAVITGPAKVENKGQKKTLCATFPIRLSEPLTDVDAEAFAESDGFSPKGYELQFWLTPNSLFRFTEFGKALGCSDEASVPEMAEYLATAGEAFAVTVKHGTSQAGRSFLQIDDPIALSQYQG